MTADRIKEIQEKTAHPNSVSVQQALLQVWNECEQNSYGLYLEAPIAGTNATITNYYPITLSSKAYDKLLAIQTKPDTKYWFKDKEVSIEELINILETA